MGLALRLDCEGEQRSIEIAVVTPETERHMQHSYAGPPGYAAEWAVSLALDSLRRSLASD